MPERIQRKRTAGWQMPEGAIYVGRPGRWGNPFVIGDGKVYRIGVLSGMARNADDAIRLYRMALRKGEYEIRVGPGGWELHEFPVTVADVRNQLAGHDLACWCPLDQPCHADVLLEIANGER